MNKKTERNQFNLSQKKIELMVKKLLIEGNEDFSTSLKHSHFILENLENVVIDRYKKMSNILSDVAKLEATNSTDNSELFIKSATEFALLGFIIRRLTDVKNYFINIGIHDFVLKFDDEMRKCMLEKKDNDSQA